MLGHHPELVAHDLSADGGAARLSCFAADGFEHGQRQLPTQGVGYQPLKAMDQLTFDVSQLSHECDCAGSPAARTAGL
ncbi:hypothetical protein I547_5590 [Mycobacterium kansasii 824]|nr:hypothetical protein I547_5590 [Mycobacterium kansasii 824]